MCGYKAKLKTAAEHRANLSIVRSEGKIADLWKGSTRNKAQVQRADLVLNDRRLIVFCGSGATLSDVNRTARATVNRGLPNTLSFATLAVTPYYEGIDVPSTEKRIASPTLW